jgi:glycosyltransferase involved in cell wall biosynthesis
VRYFADKGHDIHLVTFDKTDQIEGVEVHNLKYFSRLSYPLRILDTKKAVQKIDPDIMHAHYVSNYGVYAALTDFKPFVVSAWGSDILNVPKKSIIKKCLVRYVLKKADLITVDSASLMRNIANFGIHSEKVKLIGHGVNLRIFYPFTENKKLKEKLKIPASSLVVISTRSLEPVYDVETLIKAVLIVLKSISDVYFIVVGGGSLKRKLEMMADELRVSGNVRFVGQVSQMEVAQLLCSSDVYVSTSLSDTTSVSLLEAMACGLPVVVTELEGNMEWIRDEMNGFLFPKGDFRILADRIIYLLRNEDTRKKFGAINRQIVKERADYEKEMDKMEELYKNLIRKCEG